MNARDTISICLWQVLALCLFSNLFSQSIQINDLLNREFDLSSSHEIGDKDFYHIQTRYMEMNDSGRVAKTRVLEGSFSREVVRFEGKKRHDRFVWKYVRKGERLGKGEVTKFEELPYSRDFEYVLSVIDITPGNFPVDTGSIPKTMEGYTFLVKLIDAHSFDILRQIHHESGLKGLGQMAKDPGQDLKGIIDFPPLITDSNFSQAPIFTTLDGITLFEDKASIILAFRSDDSHIHWKMNMMDMKMPLDGTSYYWGDILLSLETGKILKGTLFERVDSLTSLPHLDKPVKNSVLREITMIKTDRDSQD